MIRRLGFTLLFVALIGVWAFKENLFPAETVTAATARVKDGDTLILNGKAFRLYGIDAPEYHQSCKTSAGLEWPCGKAARAQLDALVLSGSITCQPQAEDRYGRAVARCSSATVPDLAEAMVQAGLAISPAERGSAAYGDAEASARTARRGIWQGSFETPSQWRTDHPRKETP